MMSEFSFDSTSDWDLNAIVKGRATTSNTMNVHGVNDIPPSYASFQSLCLEDYQGSHENSAFFFNKLNPHNHGVSTQKFVDSSLVECDVYTAKSPTNEAQAKAIDVSCANTQATKSRRRKNKHKIMKAVQQARGDRVESDKWNWRKYGEKVIKGSPYPRSYYRCSYTGGCSARKQVEQSCNDPGLFLITYMEEHNHPYPIRGHSQAGRSAQRLSHASLNLLTTTKETLQNTNSMKTITSSESPINDDQVSVLRGDEGDERCTAEYVGGEDGLYDRNKVCEEGFFAGLDYLEGLSMDFYDI